MQMNNTPGFGWYFVGADLAQTQDHTAIAVLERAELTGEWDSVQFAYRKTIRLGLRYLDRLPLGISYPEIVDRIKQVVRSNPLESRCHLIVDATGVGRPVIDLLHKPKLRCDIMPVIITAGDAESSGEGYHHVPKRDLIIGLQVMLQQGGLQISAEMEGCDILVKEMLAMRVKVGLSGREPYGAWREGEHDDLVLAVALACWGARTIYPNPPYGDDNYWRRTQDQHDLKEVLAGMAPFLEGKKKK